MNFILCFLHLLSKAMTEMGPEHHPGQTQNFFMSRAHAKPDEHSEWISISVKYFEILKDFYCVFKIAHCCHFLLWIMRCPHLYASDRVMKENSFVLYKIRSSAILLRCVRHIDPQKRNSAVHKHTQTHGVKQNIHQNWKFCDHLLSIMLIKIWSLFCGI